MTAASHDSSASIRYFTRSSSSLVPPAEDAPPREQRHPTISKFLAATAHHDEHPAPLANMSDKLTRIAVCAYGMGQYLWKSTESDRVPRSSIATNASPRSVSPDHLHQSYHEVYSLTKRAGRQACKKSCVCSTTSILDRSRHDRPLCPHSARQRCQE